MVRHSSFTFKDVPPSFKHGLVLLATLIRGGGGYHKHKLRSWTGHLCQNTVQCLKYFCNWLQQHNTELPTMLTLSEGIHQPEHGASYSGINVHGLDYH